MPLTDTTLQALGNHLATLITHVSLHTANPGTTGTNVTTASRQPVTWSVDADGDLTATAALNFTGGAAGGPVTYIGFWSASTGGTFRGSQILTGDTTFNAAGEYTVTGITINGTSA